jgi:hypothetical protein
MSDQGRNQFEGVPWSDVVGLRTLLAHRYIESILVWSGPSPPRAFLPWCGPSRAAPETLRRVKRVSNMPGQTGRNSAG